MNKILFKNIATLLQVTPQTSAIRGEAMSELPAISNAYLLLENRKIAAYGEMQYCPVLDNATTIVVALLVRFAHAPRFCQNARIRI